MKQRNQNALLWVLLASLIVSITLNVLQSELADRLIEENEELRYMQEIHLSQINSFEAGEGLEDGE